MTTGEALTLRDVARAALDRNPGTSGRELDRLAKAKGLKIVYTTINALAAGTYKSRPSAATLDALAALAGMPREVVYEAARLPAPGPAFADELPPDVDQLRPHQRRAVIEVIRSFLTDIEEARSTAPAVTVLRKRPLLTEADADLAAEVGREVAARRGTSKGKALKAEADAAGEESQDTNGDGEPA